MPYETTIEELKFLYGLIRDGMSNQEILGEYARLLETSELNYPLRSDARIVKAARRQLEAAEATLQDDLRRRTDPVIAEQRRAHYQHLADIGERILSEGLRDLVEAQTEEGGTHRIGYVSWGTDVNEDFTLMGLKQQLKENIGKATDSFGLWDVTNLERHLKVENAEMQEKGLEQMANENPMGLIEFLRILNQRKIFRGTCPICQHW